MNEEIVLKLIIDISRQSTALKYAAKGLSTPSTTYFPFLVTKAFPSPSNFYLLFTSTVASSPLL